MQEALNINDFMEDARGRLVPKGIVPEIDRERDALAREIVDAARELQQKMTKFKMRAMGDVHAFVELSAEKYKARLGGNKGNITLVSFDGRLKVQISIAEHITFDERLKAAKKLIDECLTSWTDTGRDEIKIIVLDAFHVDKDGCLNVRQILGLRRFEIEDEKWQRAMEAISDSIQVMGSKSYLRVYERTAADSRWEPVPLDLAAL